MTDDIDCAKIYIKEALTDINNCWNWDAIEKLRKAETLILEYIRIESQ